LRILILSWKDPLHPSAGGAERYLVAVAKRWLADGHQVSILGPKRGKLQTQDTGSGDRGIQYLGMGSRLSVFRDARAYLRAQANTFDRVLESVSTRTFAAHRIVGDRAVALYMQTAEEVWRMEFPFPINWFGQHMLEPLWIRRMRHARVVAISPSTAAALRRRGVHAEAVIPPGCEPPRLTRKRTYPSAPPRLMWIGRLVRTKRPEDAIAAFEIIRRAMPSATLDLVGEGYLQATIKAKHYAGVSVHGFVEEAVKACLLSEADLLLLPGTREGWGIVAMEAASYGVPVIAYDIPGLRDAVLDGKTGLVVSPNPGALGSASLSLLQHVDRWRQLSEAAQRRAREFTWDRSAHELLSSLKQPSRPEVGPYSLGAAPMERSQTATEHLRSVHSKSEPRSTGDS